MITNGTRWKAVLNVSITTKPEGNRSARVDVGVYASHQDAVDNIVTEIEIASVGPGTGLELFDTMPAANAADAVMKSVNPGWVDA